MMGPFRNFLRRHGRLGPAIHVFLASGIQDVDARLKAGHDEWWLSIRHA